MDGETFEGGKDENYPLTIGSNTFIPGFEEQLIGAEIDKKVDVNVTFPEDYHQRSLLESQLCFSVLFERSRKKNCQI